LLKYNRQYDPGIAAGRTSLMIPTLTTNRYITPLREGGSLPAIVQADDGQLYVMKFTGAGQGSRALVAELMAGEIARALDLAVPPIVLLELDQAERFRWLTAPRSTVIQVSTVHCGLCVDPQATLEDLFDRLVAPPELRPSPWT
jgi:hypothetical protein